MTSIAILGANGRLGRVVAKAFIEAGYDVRAVTRSGKLPRELGKATAVAGDALDRPGLIASTAGADIVFNGLFPLVRDDLSNWTAALRMALALEPAVVVPGHGPVGDAATLHWQLDLLERLKATVKEQFDDGVPLEVAQSADIPEGFANLPLANERWSGAVSCVYRDLARGLAEGP